MAKPKKPKYSGILAKPMKPHDGPEELFKRVEALYKHYGLEFGQEDAGDLSVIKTFGTSEPIS
jgi:hypothetical protein